MHSSSGISGIVLLRWHVTKPGRPAYRAAEEIVDEAVAPAVQDLHAIGGVESLYVSKHGGREVWLTVFTNHDSILAAMRTVEPRLRCLCFRSAYEDDPARDVILDTSCSEFRGCVYRMTKVALDLHASQQFRELQCKLVRIASRNRSDRTALEPILLANSTTYQAMSERDEFWKDFTSNCLTGQNTDCGHWLYNLVLGIDWFEGEPEAKVLAELGL